MSSYEDYTATSGAYDGTRSAHGIELVLGCLATGATALADAVVLDAGCGTGNYSAAVLPHVARIEAVDANQAMLDIAGRKLAAERDAGRVRFTNGSIDQLPFPDASVDAVMVNMVLHHLGDDAANGWRAHRRVVGELARVLRPGGTLVVSTCSQTQLRDGFWYFALIPRAVEAVRHRIAPLDVLEQLCADHGLRRLGRFVPVDAVLQGDAYFDPHGPLDDGWRGGDSTWALVDDDELASVRATITDLDARDALADFVAERDARRAAVGQATFLSARRVES